MTLDYIILLAVVQGFTEFLPVSSSAHLAMLPSVVGAADQGMFVDVAAHVGSLLAVMWHYRARVTELLFFKNIDLMKKLVLSFLPVLALGLFIDPPRGLFIIAINSIVFGIFLFLADRFGRSERDVSFMTAFLAGLAEAAALIPGVSRSGVTITMMRARGVSRRAALDFAFMMSMPAIAAAGGYELLKAVQSAADIDWIAAGMTVVLSALFSLVAIRLMLGLAQRFSFAWFSVYRILLGLILLIFYIH